MSLQYITAQLHHFASRRSVTGIIVYSFALRLLTLFYCLLHDRYVSYIKFTDIDYHVFTNGSILVLAGKSPYSDSEYRYSPLVAFTFIPNLLIWSSFGKILLSLADVLAAYYLYKLNIYQGTNRIRTKLFLLFWLLNPLNIAIATRGSFEPVISLVILACISYLSEQKFFISGLLFGLSIHLKLYPIIYCLPVYLYLLQKKPYIKTQSKTTFWTKAVLPNTAHVIFFGSAFVSLVSTSLFSYHQYGRDYIEQSFLYHLKRQDLQHNFSMYFYLFKLFPGYRDTLSSTNFLFQFVVVIFLSIRYFEFETNKRTRLRRLTFSLFICTFAFVSFNKVCTSQYFIWYLTFLPLILESQKLNSSQASSLATFWILTQAQWLLFAFLYEYQKLPVFNQVGMCSIMFFFTNIIILIGLCKNFDATQKRSETPD